MRFLLLVLLTLSVSCATTVYQYPSPRDASQRFTSSQVTVDTGGQAGKFLSKLGRNLPGYQEPPPPSPDDVLVAEEGYLLNDLDSLGDFAAAVFLKEHNVEFQGTWTSGGREQPIVVTGRVRDLAGKTKDPATGQEVDEQQFTRSAISDVVATVGGREVFRLPGALTTWVSIPYILATTPDGTEIRLTTLDTYGDTESDVRKALHGLLHNLRMATQRFELLKDGRVLAWFDQKLFAWDTAVDPEALRAVAAAVVGFQLFVNHYHIEDAVSIRPTEVLREGTPLPIQPRDGD